MEYPFPPDMAPSSSDVRHHLWMVAFLIGCVVWLIVTMLRPARLWALIAWPMVALLALLFGQSGMSPDNPFRPFVIAYQFVIWGVAALAMVLATVRLIQQQRSQAAAWTLFFLIPTVIVLVIIDEVTCFRRPPPGRGGFCRSNAMMIGLAMHMSHDDHGRFPDSNMAEPGDPPLSWRVGILAYYDSPREFKEYDTSRTWDDPVNRRIGRSPPGRWPAFSCGFNPNRRNLRDEEGRFYTAFVLVTGPGTIFPDGKGISIDEITDGTSNTLMATEAVGLNVVWTEPRDFDVGTEPIGVNLPGKKPGHSPGLLSSYHIGGAHALKADGAVRFISEKIDPQVLQALTTASGGEAVDDW